MADKKTKQKMLQFLGLYFLYYILILLLKTLRIKKENSANIEKSLAENKNFVLVFWHGTMLVPWFFHGRKNFSALVSQSKDGEILTRILSRWAYSVIRGSSNVGGKQALELMLIEANKGRNIAVTPDGPKGPAHEMKAGAVVCAKKSGIPLYLLGIGYSKKYVLNSWDKFEVPKPFSKVCLVYSDPILIDPDLDYDSTSGIIKECEQQLKTLQTKGLELCLS